LHREAGPAAGQHSRLQQPQVAFRHWLADIIRLGRHPERRPRRCIAPKVDRSCTDGTGNG
jgi:ABC-type hemin transport system ATPase subunit